MRKFTRHVTLDELKSHCGKLGLEVDTTKHDRDFSDYVTVTGILAGMPFGLLYSTFNGRFFGYAKNSHRIQFDQSSDHLDDVPWYAAILELLFVSTEKTAAEVERAAE